MVLYMGASVEDIKINGEVPIFEDSETESIAGDGAGHWQWHGLISYKKENKKRC